MLLHLHEYSTYYIHFLYFQLKCNIKLNCNTTASNQLHKLKINSFLCFVVKYNYKILADIQKNLLEAKVCNCLSQVMETCNGNFYCLFFTPYTSEVYKVNTFSLNSVLENFPAISNQDHFCFLNERELQMNQQN